VDRRRGGRDAPELLPMPLQSVLASQAHQWMSRFGRSDSGRHAGWPDRGPDERDPTRTDIVAELVSGVEAASRRLDDIGGS